MAWTRQTGSAAAKQLVADYPTPRAFRQAVQERTLHALLSTEVKALRMACDHTENTLGYYLDHGGLDLGLLYAVVRAQAADVDVWVAPNGTKTIRPV